MEYKFKAFERVEWSDEGIAAYFVGARYENVISVIEEYKTDGRNVDVKLYILGTSYFEVVVAKMIQGSPEIEVTTNVYPLSAIKRVDEINAKGRMHGRPDISSLLNGCPLTLKVKFADDEFSLQAEPNERGNRLADLRDFGHKLRAILK